MPATHTLDQSHHHEEGFPTLAFAWAHFAVALLLGVSGFNAWIPPILGILGMAFFAMIAMLFVLMTLSKPRD
ncbi:MAG TPA: hypothetical protein VMI31_09560 [Fimbriimonadaceae bacterium]|nr:hypothetical protein [Fimbriimonadaceae bacterium]